MARNIAFSELVLQLRAELRRSQDPAVGVEDLAPLKQTINHIVNVVANKRDWPFLHRKFPRINLEAGQRYYDLPNELDQERITFFKLKYNGSWYDLEQGIVFDDYQSFDPEDDERSDPTLKFDFVDIDGAVQIEVWPLPAGDSSYLYLEGYKTVPKMVDDDDTCPFDDDIIVLFAAAELLQSVNEKEAAAKRDLANDLLNNRAVRGARNANGTVQIGLGDSPSKGDNGRAVVRISGT